MACSFGGARATGRALPRVARRRSGLGHRRSPVAPRLPPSFGAGRDCDRPGLFFLDGFPQPDHCPVGLRVGWSVDDYGAGVQGARAFLEGEDASPLEALERAMAEAAAALAFERAGVLRDKLDVLPWLSGCLKRLREAAVQRFVYPVAGAGGEVWYL